MQETNYIIKLSALLKAILKIIPSGPRVALGLYYAKYFPDNKTTGLAYFFKKAANKNPNGYAVLYEDKKYTYKELDEWSNKIGNMFLSKGLVKGDSIALFMENRPEYLAILLGSAKIGIGAALINNSQKGKVLLHSLNLLKPKMIIVGEELIDIFSEVSDSTETPKEDLYFMPEEPTDLKVKSDLKNIAFDIKSSPSDDLNSYSIKVTKKTPLFYIYTSGTTGLPKASTFNNGRFTKGYGLFGSVTMRYKMSDILYVTLPLYHATGLVVAWGAIMEAAGTFAIDKKFSASKFWSRIAKFNATSFAYVGELCNYLISQPLNEYEVNNKVTSVIGNGLRLGKWMEFKKRFGIEKVGEFYASSEGNVGFSNIFNFDHTCGFGGVPYSIVKFDKDINKPVIGSDGKMIAVKKGETGLLIGKITKVSPFDGYTEKEKSEKALLHNCFEKGDAYFNTGDLVRDQGFKHVQFVDRTGDSYRWKGENVSTTEVENIFLDFESINEVVVYGVEVPGCNGKAGMANIITKEGDDKIDYAKLVEYLKKNMPKYSIPLFIRVSNVVDTTGTFKYAKSKLKKQSFYPDRIDEGDKLLVKLPGENSYNLLTPELVNQIENKDISF